MICTLCALGYIAVQKDAPTKIIMVKVKQLLDYAATHPDSIVTYNASDMVLAGHRDASYLSETKACIRAGGNFSCQTNPLTPLITVSYSPSPKSSRPSCHPQRRPNLVPYSSISARPCQNDTHSKKWSTNNPPTPMQTDNTTALGVVHKNLAKKQLKSMDMKFH